MTRFETWLEFDAEPTVIRKDVLKDVPRDAAPLVRKLWANRVELTEWLAGDPERPQMLIEDPVKALGEALPDLELPSTVPGDELRKQLLEHVSPERVVLQLEQPDPTTTEAVKLYGLLLDRVNAGTTTPEQIAADPEGAVQAAAVAGTSPEAMTRVVAAIRFVLGLPAQMLELAPDRAHLPLSLEQFSSRVRPRRRSKR